MPQKQTHSRNRRNSNKPVSKATPARILALEITKEVRQREAYARELIDSRRETSQLSPEEFSYAQVLTFGVVMCRGTLDEALNRCMNRPNDVKPKVRDALRISAYELLFLNKPAHVVVDQGVELVRHVTPKAAGVANAVLHKLVANVDEFPWGDASEDPAALARKAGMPLWLTQELIGQYGWERATEMFEANLQGAPTYTALSPFKSNARFACDLASQQTASVVALEEPLLEIGAGRGTKTLLLESRAKETLGHTLALHTVELHEYKTRLLQERMEYMGVEGVVAHAGDACALEDIPDLPEVFPSVFVDAPCSGTGTLRRHPEIRWNLKPADVESLASLQLNMLKAAAKRVAQGGSLVYATCSVLHQENAGVVETFLASEEGRNFAIEPAQSHFAEFDNCITSSGYFASIPVCGGPDGHFAVILRRIKA